MDEPTLYRRGKPTFEEPVHWEWFDELVRAGVLVPVERCEHKRIDGHMWCDYHQAATWHANCRVDANRWCPGAEIGDTDGCEDSSILAWGEHLIGDTDER